MKHKREEVAMKWAVFIFFIALIVSPAHSWSQPDALENKKGERTTLANENCRNVKESLNDCRSLFGMIESLKPREVVFMVSYCGHPILRNLLTDQEKKLLTNISPQAEENKKKLSPKELNEIDLVNKHLYSICRGEENKKYSKKELDELGQILKNNWKRMNESLAKDDIETALSYYAEPYRDSWRQRFQAFAPAVREKMIRESLEAQLHLVTVQGTRAICHLVTTRNGERYSFQLTFLKDAWGEWKILSY